MTAALALRPASTAVLERAAAISAAISDVVDVTFPASPEAEVQASALLRELETMRRQAETERKIEKAPHLDAGRAVDAAFARVLEPLERVAGIIRQRLSEAATRREEAKRLAVQAASVAALAGDAATANAAIALANDPVFAPVAAEGVAEKVTWEIVDRVDVETCPREYLQPDVPKILAYARALPAGVEPKIPGVTFRRVVSHVVRSVR